MGCASSTHGEEEHSQSKNPTSRTYEQDADEVLTASDGETTQTRSRSGKPRDVRSVSSGKYSSFSRKKSGFLMTESYSEDYGPQDQQDIEGIEATEGSTSATRKSKHDQSQSPTPKTVWTFDAEAMTDDDEDDEDFEHEMMAHEMKYEGAIEGESSCASDEDDADGEDCDDMFSQPARRSRGRSKRQGWHLFTEARQEKDRRRKRGNSGASSPKPSRRGSVLASSPQSMEEYKSWTENISDEDPYFQTTVEVKHGRPAVPLLRPALRGGGSDSCSESESAHPQLSSRTSCSSSCASAMLSPKKVVSFRVTNHY